MAAIGDRPTACTRLSAERAEKPTSSRLTVEIVTNPTLDPARPLLRLDILRELNEGGLIDEPKPLRARLLHHGLVSELSDQFGENRGVGERRPKNGSAER
jgi:hypothetical protein